MAKASGMRAVELPEEVIDYLQMLDYELGGLQVLHSHALGAGVPPEKLSELRRECQEKFAEFQLAKLEVAKDHGGAHAGAKWSIDYIEGVMRVEG